MKLVKRERGTGNGEAWIFASTDIARASLVRFAYWGRRGHTLTLLPRSPFPVPASGISP